METDHFDRGLKTDLTKPSGQAKKPVTVDQVNKNESTLETQLTIDFKQPTEHLLNMSKIPLSTYQKKRQFNVSSLSWYPIR